MFLYCVFYGPSPFSFCPLVGRCWNFTLFSQIDVADKKYKTTQKFLDDQANEREQERDEAQKKIDMLYGQLRERDKDKVNCERVTSEVSEMIFVLRLDVHNMHPAHFVYNKHVLL